METIIGNALAWIVIHLGISYGCLQLHRNFFWHNSWLYKQRSWEKHGRLYERLGIKAWKKLAPDGGSWFQGGFRKKQLECVNKQQLYLFFLETKRAELVHWLSMPPALLFFLWNEVDVGFVMILYAIGFNLPLIIIQRYNRIRLQRIISRR